MRGRGRHHGAQPHLTQSSGDQEGSSAHARAGDTSKHQPGMDIGYGHLCRPLITMLQYSTPQYSLSELLSHGYGYGRAKNEPQARIGARHPIRLYKSLQTLHCTVFINHSCAPNALKLKRPGSKVKCSQTRRDILGSSCLKRVLSEC